MAILLRFISLQVAREYLVETQVAIIRHCAGPKLIEIFDQFTYGPGESEDDKKHTTKVLKKITTYCNPRKCEVLEAFRFWSVQYDSIEGFSC